MNDQKVPINVVYSDVKMPTYARWTALKNPKYEEYRRKWTHNPQKFILENLPLHVDVEPTSLCNLRCPMCQSVRAKNAGSPEFEREGLMEMSLFRKVIDDISDGEGGGTQAIKLSCRGEPLLHPNLVEMVRYAKQRNILEVAFNTNGVLLTKELSEQLLDAGLDCLFFSFDAATKETYEKIRIGAEYEPVLHNIRKFVSLRNAKKAFGTMVRVGMVVTDVNQDETEAFLRLFEGIADLINFNKESRDMTKISENTVRDERNGALLNIREHGFICSMPWQRLRVYWDGSIGLCCNDYWGAVSHLNVKEYSIEEIWKRLDIQRYRDAHQSGKWWSIQPCITCPFPFHST